MLVYPNPTTGQITIRNYELGTAQPSTELMANDNIEIYDIIGRIVHTSTLNSSATTIDISHLQNGMYYLRIGNEMVKIVKK